MLKIKFIDSTLKLIKHYYPNYNEKDFKTLRYGLEGIYLTFSKLIILILIAIILKIEKEVLLLILLFSLIRLSASGVHASKSWICLITSLIFFLTTPIILKYITISFFQKLFIGLICLIIFIRYAPADTKKRPIVNKNKKYILKISTIITAIIFVSSSLVFKNALLVNSLIGAVIIEAIMILPITYKLYNQ